MDIIDQFLKEDPRNIQTLENFVLFCNNLFLDETLDDAQLATTILDAKAMTIATSKKIEKKLHTFLIIVQNAESERCMHLDIFDIVFYALDYKNKNGEKVELSCLVYELSDYYFNKIKK